MHNQKEDNNQSKINKQPEVPENQTAWNSDNHRIKEMVKQNTQTSKAVDGEKPRQGSNHAGWAAYSEAKGCTGEVVPVGFFFPLLLVFHAV